MFLHVYITEIPRICQNEFNLPIFLLGGIDVSDVHDLGLRSPVQELYIIAAKLNRTAKWGHAPPPSPV